MCFFFKYKTYIRPHLEYAIQAWAAYANGDIETIERIQKRTTKIMDGFGKLCYEERLGKLGLTKLCTRWIRGDLIQQYKFMNLIDKIEWSTPQKTTASLQCEGPATNIRGHKYRLSKQKATRPQRVNFFTNRVVNPWNDLTQDAISARTTNKFKEHIDHQYGLHSYKKNTKIQSK